MDENKPGTGLGMAHGVAGYQRAAPVTVRLRTSTEEADAQ
jgi:hypothetical protein